VTKLIDRLAGYITVLRLDDACIGPYVLEGHCIVDPDTLGEGEQIQCNFQTAGDPAEVQNGSLGLYCLNVIARPWCIWVPSYAPALYFFLKKFLHGAEKNGREPRQARDAGKAEERRQAEKIKWIFGKSDIWWCLYT
jgi:hypothetical protein